MCGVIGLIYERQRADLGSTAAELLKALEYRGYDSTGAALQGAGPEVDLRKGVGAPSVMVKKLGIVGLPGQILCGQVRWATFGAVDEANAQPHVVRCHTYLYGAHNGNVTNCDELKNWLTSEGHRVLSDNDGEMVVHTVEHYFAKELSGAAVERRAAMRRAIVRAAARLSGSYAAVIVDPISRCLWSVKQGSSLYFGVGTDPEGGAFSLASSDLSAILGLTRQLVPLAAGEMVEHDALGFRVYSVQDGSPLERGAVRSKLRARDTSLSPKYQTYMQQEIDAQPQTCKEVVELFVGGASAPRAEGDESRDGEAFRAAVDRFTELAAAAEARGGRLLALSCGSSYHAASSAALFFNEIAHSALVPLLPGEFRARYSRSLRDGDVVIAVSQSGETKDLIDVMNDVGASGSDVARVALVNNVSSTLALEKSDVVIPLHCGPEIAVPATKSVMNQLVMFYGLALRLAERRQVGDAALRRARLPELAAVIREALDSSQAAVEQAAEMLYLAPSLHILGTRLPGVAMEGALKIREVVLNHCQGYEASEFKHGPNTILGFNTVWGPRQLELALAAARSGAAVLDPSVVAALSTDYPLVYVTGPEPRDVALTVSQINTHKIRGSATLVVAEESAELRQAAEKAPANRPGYRSTYIALPRNGDPLLAVFSATAVLQRLALAMSLKKAAYLDRLGVREHGVHPDIPKNVSKSITVD